MVIQAGGNPPGAGSKGGPGPTQGPAGFGAPAGAGQGPSAVGGTPGAPAGPGQGSVGIGPAGPAAGPVGPGPQAGGNPPGASSKGGLGAGAGAGPGAGPGSEAAGAGQGPAMGGGLGQGGGAGGASGAMAGGNPPGAGNKGGAGGTVGMAGFAGPNTSTNVGQGFQGGIGPTSVGQLGGLGPSVSGANFGTDVGQGGMNLGGLAVGLGSAYGGFGPGGPSMPTGMDGFAGQGTPSLSTAVGDISMGMPGYAGLGAGPGSEESAGLAAKIGKIGLDMRDPEDMGRMMLNRAPNTIAEGLTEITPDTLAKLGSMYQRTVAAEAANQPALGQAGVAGTLLTRTRAAEEGNPVPGALPSQNVPDFIRDDSALARIFTGYDPTGMRKGTSITPEFTKATPGSKTALSAAAAFNDAMNPEGALAQTPVGELGLTDFRTGIKGYQGINIGGNITFAGPQMGPIAETPSTSTAVGAPVPGVSLPGETTAATPIAMRAEQVAPPSYDPNFPGYEDQPVGRLYQGYKGETYPGAPSPGLPGYIGTLNTPTSRYAGAYAPTYPGGYVAGQPESRPQKIQDQLAGRAAPGAITTGAPGIGPGTTVPRNDLGMTPDQQAQAEAAIGNMFAAQERYNRMQQMNAAAQRAFQGMKDQSRIPGGEVPQGTYGPMQGVPVEPSLQERVQGYVNPPTTAPAIRSDYGVFPAGPPIATGRPAPSFIGTQGGVTMVPQNQQSASIAPDTRIEPAGWSFAKDQESLLSGPPSPYAARGAYVAPTPGLDFGIPGSLELGTGALGPTRAPAGFRAFPSPAQVTVGATPFGPRVGAPAVATRSLAPAKDQSQIAAAKDQARLAQAPTPWGGPEPGISPPGILQGPFRQAALESPGQALNAPKYQDRYPGFGAPNYPTAGPWGGPTPGIEPGLYAPGDQPPTYTSENWGPMQPTGPTQLTQPPTQDEVARGEVEAPQTPADHVLARRLGEITGRPDMQHFPVGTFTKRKGAAPVQSQDELAQLGHPLPAGGLKKGKKGKKGKLEPPPGLPSSGPGAIQSAEETLQQLFGPSGSPADWYAAQKSKLAQELAAYGIPF